MFEYLKSAIFILPSLWILYRWIVPPQMTPASDPAPSEERAVLLFQGDRLVDLCPLGMIRLPLIPGQNDWTDLHETLRSRFPDFPKDPPPTETLPILHANPAHPTETAKLEPVTDGMRIVLTRPHDFDDVSDPTEYFDELRGLGDALPIAAWKTALDGRVVWSNSAHDTLRNRMKTPPPDRNTPIIRPTHDPAQRHCILIRGGLPPEWYTLSTYPTQDGCLYFAENQTKVVSAEEARKDFVQTLSKTFAHLPTGLAIFNRDRRLMLFNPALTDLTALSPSFLGPRPTIDTFFDALRENRHMPEPKDYRGWRQRITDVIHAAEEGGFEETWPLESGQTLRVKGQPYPDGALAFVIEDISAEVSLTRNFRAELELGQNMLDTFDDAIAVFSQTGLLTFSNVAYDRLWGFNSSHSFAEVTIGDALRLWRDRCSSDTDLRKVHDTVLTFGERKMVSFELTVKDAGLHQCAVVPVTADATLVRFAPLPVIAPKKASALSD